MLRSSGRITPMNDTECIHGMEPQWCSICRQRDGFRPGTDRKYNDCTIVSVMNLTGGTYEEANELMKAAGIRPGKGAYAEQVHEALNAAGWTVRQYSGTIAQAVASGRNFHVSGRRGKVGHSWAIVNGTQLNQWRDGFRYRIWEVS